MLGAGRAGGFRAANWCEPYLAPSDWVESKFWANLGEFGHVLVLGALLHPSPQGGVLVGFAVGGGRLGADNHQTPVW